MNEVAAAQREVIEEFAFFDDWMDRYQYLIDLGRRLPALADDEMVEANRIKGCQSQVWLVSEPENGRMAFRAISDAAIVSGLIALLLRIYSGKPLREIVETPPDFLFALELQQHLSPTRSNGLASLLETIRARARAALEAA